MKQAHPLNRHEVLRQREDQERKEAILRERPTGYDARQQVRPYPADYVSPTYKPVPVPPELKKHRKDDPPPAEPVAPIKPKPDMPPSPIEAVEKPLLAADPL